VVVKRTKEIGIRKTVGASTFNILKLISREFTLWVLLAFAISLPPAAWIMNRWLQDFAYRIGLEWWIFAVTGLILVIITFLTISFQTIRAARSNPVDALRYE
jgi:putative ABC transport system permease protein